MADRPQAAKPWIPEEAEMTREVWMPVLGFEGTYDVSNLGKIRRNDTGLILKPSKTNGYLHVSLSQDAEVRTVRVHVVVLSAFCGPAPFPAADAAHNDGNKENCRLTNLRWASKIDNSADVLRHGRRPTGSEVFGSKLTEDNIITIRQRIAAGLRNPPIAEEFGVSISTIHLIRHGKTWRHLDGRGA